MEKKKREVKKMGMKGEILEDRETEGIRGKKKIETSKEK